MDDIHIKYLVSSYQDSLWGLTVSTVGYQHIAPGSAYPPPNHPRQYLFSTLKGRILDEYVLLYITHGSGIYSSFNKKNIQLRAGNLLLLFPGEWHSYKPDATTGWDEYWIGFKGSHMEGYIGNNFFDKQKEIFNVGPNLELVQLYKNALAIAIEQNPGFQQLLAGITDHLLAIAVAATKDSSNDLKNARRRINKAKMIMFENSHTEIDLKDVASNIYMSYSWFRRLFKEYTGLSPYQYIQELRIRKSKELLTATTLTCQEIAYRTGFDNPMHFSSMFKKKTGLSPTKYRSIYQYKNG